MSATETSNSPTASSNLQKEVRSHEVALAELNALASSRTVYQRNGNILFRTTTQKAIAVEEKKLQSAKARLQKLSST